MKLYTYFKAMEKANNRSEFFNAGGMDEIGYKYTKMYFHIRDGFIRRMEQKELEIELFRPKQIRNFVFTRKND